MLKFIREQSILIARIAAVVMLALIVLQFIPFWTYPATVKNDDGTKSTIETTASINEYVYFPNEVIELNRHFKTLVGRTVETNEAVAPPVIVLVVGAAGIILTILKPRSKWLIVFATVVGLAVLIGYPTNLILVFGEGLIYHIILAAILILLSILIYATLIEDWINFTKGKKAVAQNTLEAELKKVEIATKEVNSSNVSESDRAYNKLLAWLNDDVPEVRVKAIEGLGVSTKEAAITHLTHNIMIEEDKEMVLKMRAAIVSIRENIAKQMEELKDN